MFDPNFWHWVLIACVFFSAEILIGTEFLLWLGLAALTSGIIKLVVPEISWEVQYVLFALFCVISLVIWRRFSKSAGEIESDQPRLNQRNQQYIGRTLVLSQAIENGYGKVVVDDSRWKVAGEDLPINSKVRVVGVDGSILNVEAVE